MTSKDFLNKLERVSITNDINFDNKIRFILHHNHNIYQLIPEFDLDVSNDVILCTDEYSYKNKYDKPLIIWQTALKHLYDSNKDICFFSSIGSENLWFKGEIIFDSVGIVNHCYTIHLYTKNNDIFDF